LSLYSPVTGWLSSISAKPSACPSHPLQGRRREGRERGGKEKCEKTATEERVRRDFRRKVKD